MASNAPMAVKSKTVGKDLPGTRSFMVDDYPTIRNASMTFLTCIVLGATLIIGSGFLLSRQLEAVVQARRADGAAREQYRQSEKEMQEIQDFQPKYLQLATKGLVGAERRLDWVEAIQTIQQNSALLPINYEITSQQAFQVDPSVDTGTLELRGSKMLVKLNLLHEMDLLNFFDELRAKQTVALHDCDIKRLVVSPSEKLAPRLFAECTLYWITLGKRGESENATDVTQAGQ